MVIDLMSLCDRTDDSLQSRLWMEQAVRMALLSGDQSTKNGAVIVQEGEIVARGYNDFIPGFGYLPEHHERPFKYSVIEHAERRVVYDAARNGERTGGGIMVANWVACPDCARAIVLAGIKEVICHAVCMERTPERWFNEVSLGLKMLRDNNVTLTYFTGECGVDNLNNGEWIVL